MKKFLSLVLALVMVMSLTVISAGADDFTDYDEVNYDEAVDVITALDIMDGYGETFGPTGGLSRGAAAKIICNLILGPTTARALSADTAPYPDVPVSNEFSGYIAYCQAQGIISGYADGTFKPTAPLSNYAFMKMLLGALGYDAEIEKYVGANWSVQVAKQAVGIGLDNGLEGELNGTAPATREQAALYAFNTLKSIMVEYPERTEITTADGVTVTTNSARIDVVNDLYGDETIKVDGKMQFAEKYFSKLTRINNMDAFGRPANEWKWKSEVVGLYADPSDLVAEYSKKAPVGELFTTAGSSIVSGLKNGDYDLTVYVDGELVVDLPAEERLTSAEKAAREAAVENLFVRNSSAAAQAVTSYGTGVSGNGIITEMYMDDDSNITIVMVSTWLGKATADYNTTRESVTIEPIEINNGTPARPSLPTTLEQEDFDVDEIAEGDYILMQYSYMTNAVEVVEKAEVLTGEVSEFTVADYVIMDGEKKTYNKLVSTSHKSDEYTIGEDAVVVLDAAGYIIYIDEAISTSSYVFIEDAASKSGLNTTPVAAAYFLDGTYAEIDVEKLVDRNGNDIKGTARSDYDYYSTDLYNDMSDGWFTFIKNSAGKYVLSAVRSPRNSGSVDSSANTGDGITDPDQIVYNGRVQFMANNTAMSRPVLGNADTIFVVLDADEDVYVYTGVANVPDITLSDNFSVNGAGEAVRIHWTVDANGYAEYVFIDLTADTGSKVDDVNTIGDWLFLLKATGNKTVNVDNEVYYQYKVLFDGEETTKYIESSILSGGKGTLGYKIKANDKDYITDATEVGDTVNDSKANDEHYKIALDGAITQSGKTIKLGTGVGTYANYITTADTSINLIVDGNANTKALLKDKGADYETHVNQTLGTIAGIVYGYDVTGTAYVVVDDEEKEIATDIYIWVTSATQTGGGGGGTEYTVTLSGDVATQTATTVGGAASFNIVPEAGYTYSVDKGTINADFTTISISGVTENTTITVTKTATGESYIALAEDVTGKGTLDTANAVVGVNAAGDIVAQVSLTAPTWVDEASDVTVTYDVYLNSKTELNKYLTGQTAGSVDGYATNNVYEISVTHADTLTPGTVVIVEITDVVYDAVDVQYKIGDTVITAKTGDDLPATLPVGATNKLATETFTLATANWAADGTPTFVSMENGTSDATAGATITINTAFDINNVYADGDAAVIINLSGIKAKPETWTITEPTPAAIKTYKAADAAAFDGTDGELVLTLTATPDSALSTDAATKAFLTAELDSNVSNVFGYKVTVTVDGTTYGPVIVKGTTKVNVGSFTITKSLAASDFTIAAEEITKPAPVVTDSKANVTISGNAISVLFDRAIALVDSTKVAVTSDGTTSVDVVGVEIDEDGKTLVVYTDGTELASNATITISAGAVAETVTTANDNLNGGWKLTGTLTGDTWSWAAAAV